MPDLSPLEMAELPSNPDTAPRPAPASGWMSFAALALVGGGLFLVLALSAVAAPSAGSTAGSPANERQGEMIAIPACDFTMGGTDANAFDNEKPVGKVFVAAFHMGKYEVTNAQFAAFLNANGGRTKDDSGDDWVDVHHSDFQLAQEGRQWKPKVGKEHHPVVDVTWFGAMRTHNGQGPGCQPRRSGKRPREEPMEGHIPGAANGIRRKATSQAKRPRWGLSRAINRPTGAWTWAGTCVSG